MKHNLDPVFLAKNEGHKNEKKTKITTQFWLHFSNGGQKKKKRNFETPPAEAGWDQNLKTPKRQSQPKSEFFFWGGEDGGMKNLPLSPHTPLSL